MYMGTMKMVEKMKRIHRGSRTELLKSSTNTLLSEKFVQLLSNMLAYEPQEGLKVMNAMQFLIRQRFQILSKLFAPMLKASRALPRVIR